MLHQLSSFRGRALIFWARIALVQWVNPEMGANNIYSNLISGKLDLILIIFKIV